MNVKFHNTLPAAKTHLLGSFCCGKCDSADLFVLGYLQMPEEISQRWLYPLHVWIFSPSETKTFVKWINRTLATATRKYFYTHPLIVSLKCPCEIKIAKGLLLLFNSWRIWGSRRSKVLLVQVCIQLCLQRHLKLVMKPK